MHVTPTRVSLALALLLFAARGEAQMPDAAPPSPNGWTTNSWSAPHATLRRLPSCEDDLLTFGNPTLASVSALTGQPFATAQPVGFKGLVDLRGSGKCDTKGKCETCCPAPWAHRCGVFAEVMMLRARDAEVAYAVPVDGDIEQAENPIQVAPIALVDPDYSFGFRFGGSLALDPCRSVAVTYSRLDSNTSNQIEEDPALVIDGLVLHPGTINAGDYFLTASASMGIDYDLIDADYRSILSLGRCSVINWFAGVRFARLNQDFNASFTQTGTVDTVATDIDFEGGGIRLGLDGARHHSCGLLIYGRGATSLMAGEFTADYRQGEDFDPEIVNTTWRAGRIVPIMDLELGAGWQSPCGRCRLTAGYQISYWFNTVTTDQWIRSVHTNSFIGQPDRMSYDTISFDGFVARAEYRF